MKYRVALASLACVIVPGTVLAETVTGPYVSLGGGLAIHPSNNFTYRAAGASGNLQWKLG